MHNETEQKIMDKVTNFLSYKPRTEYEIKSRLDRYVNKESISKEEKSRIRNNIIGALEKSGYFDDESVVDEYVKNFLASSKPRSRKSLYVFLARKGVSGNVISKGLNNISDEIEKENILKEIESKFSCSGGLVSAKDRNKMYTYLARKGYSSNLIYECINQT